MNTFSGKLPDFFDLAAHRQGSCPSTLGMIIESNFVTSANIRFPVGITHTEDTAFLSSLALSTDKIYFSSYAGAYYRLDAENNSKQSRPTTERYVVEMLKDVKGRSNSVNRFICKNLVHLAYNCVEYNDRKSFQKAISDEFFKEEYASNYYTWHLTLLRIIPFLLLRLLFMPNQLLNIPNKVRMWF